MGKKKQNIEISFVDEPASEDVTGSMLYIETPKHQLLIDAGLHQTNDRYEDFLVNNRKFREFKPKNIDLMFITHNHADHALLAPKLFKDGCRAKVIVPTQNKNVLEIMARDCAEINERDVLMINSQHDKDYQPLYGMAEVDLLLSHTTEYQPLVKHVIDDEISFELYPSGHLLGGCQILLYITIGSITKKILITGDLGNRLIDNKFVGHLVPVPCADIVIGESTYGDRPDIKTNMKDRNTDRRKLKAVIDTQVCLMHGRVVIPTFAQSRAQQLVYEIYMLYKDNPDFNYKVYVDSPLSIEVFLSYAEDLDDEERSILFDLLKWKNLAFVKEPEQSKALVASSEPAIILSTSGMCQVGRVRHHLKRLVGDPNATVLFVGFSTPGSLASILKDPKRDSITIDGKEYKIRCSSYSLKSFSGHMPFPQLVDYYSSINCQKIILHHGSTSAKLGMKAALEKRLEEECKSTRVIAANSSLIVRI